jgi:hypothetical protein
MASYTTINGSIIDCRMFHQADSHNAHADRQFAVGFLAGSADLGTPESRLQVGAPAGIEASVCSRLSGVVGIIILKTAVKPRNHTETNVLHGLRSSPPW